MISPELLTEPGFWALAFLIFVGAEKAFGAALSRNHFRQLNAAVDAALASPKYVAATESERAKIKGDMADHLHAATAWYSPLMLTWIAPKVAVAHLWHVVVNGKTPRRRAQPDFFRDLAFGAALRKSPVITAWVLGWMYACVWVGKPFKRVDRDRLTAPLFEAASRRLEGHGH